MTSSRRPFNVSCS